MWISPPSNLISKILSPALQLWLRSQVEAVETLEANIQGRDRQILSGYIPQVTLNSRRAIYQGLHLGTVQLRGENIRINIAQVIKGKPLKLLEPIRVSGEIQLSETDLQASLASSLLIDAFRELLVTLLTSQGISPQILEAYQIGWHEVKFSPSHFTLKGSLTDSNQIHPLLIDAGLSLIDLQTLHFDPIILTGIPQLNSDRPPALSVDLGSDVSLEALTLTEGSLLCQGNLLIRP